MSDEMPSYEELKEMPDHEILILVVQKLRSFGINQCNHLKHHQEIAKRYWRAIFICIAVGLTGIINLGIAFLVLFCKG